MTTRHVVPLPTPPADLEEFWHTRYEHAAACALRPRIIRDEGVHAGIRRLAVEFTSTDDVTIGAWVALPSDGIVDRGIVFLHGYGGLTLDGVRHPTLPCTAAIWPCLRGMGELSTLPGLPTVSAEHVLAGIQSHDSYIHGGCVEDTWNAITALTTLFPDAATRIDLVGGSFGGGIGAMATA